MEEAEIEHDDLAEFFIDVDESDIIGLSFGMLMNRVTPHFDFEIRKPISPTDWEVLVSELTKASLKKVES